MPRHLSDLQKAHALQLQLGALQRAVDLFDLGYETEAPRIATILRVMLHTGRDPSLLKQLDLHDKKFFNSSIPFDSENLIGHHGLLLINIENSSASYFPRLGDAGSMSSVPFDTWWNEIVLDDLKGSQLSRKKLVLTSANKDGGAHIDSSLPESYGSLKDDNSLGWLQSHGAPLEGNPVQTSIRQIAHEVLQSFLSSYEKTPADIKTARRTSEISNGKMRFSPHESQFFKNSMNGPIEPGHRYQTKIQVDKITSGALFTVVNGAASEPIFLPGSHEDILVAGSEDSSGVYGALTDAVVGSISIRKVLPKGTA